MNKTLLNLSMALCLVLMGLTNGLAQGQVYEETFTGGQTYCPGSANYDNWGTFRASLDPVIYNYQWCKMSGTENTTGVTCTDPAIVDQIALALKNAVEQSIVCDGVTWRIGTACITGCAVTGDDVELNSNNSGGDCACAAGPIARPCIGNANWGGFGATSCNAPTQTMRVEFYALPPYDDDAGVGGILNPSLPTCGLDSQDVTIKLENLGLDTLVNCTIFWQINTGTPSSLVYNGSVDPQGGCDTVVLTNFNFTNGDSLTVWTTAPNGAVDSLWQNDTMTLNISSGLLGTYQIPGDYADFASAIVDLETFGVCGDVIMNAAVGTYNEQLEIGVIDGVGPMATVTFQGATGNPNDVILEFDPSVPFSQDGVIKLSGTDYITFQDMTIDNLSSSTSYGRVILLQTGVSHVMFDNCNINGSTANTTSTNNCVVDGYNIAMEDITFTNNHVSNGSYAFRLYGVPASHNNGFNISNNVIDSFYIYGIYNYYNDSTIIEGNDISTDVPYTGSIYGLRIWDCDKQLDIKSNRIYNVEGAELNTGIYVYNCDGSLNNRLNISNNCVTVGNVGDNDFAYGLYMFNTGLADVVNNTITNLNTSGTGYGHYVGGGGLIDEFNNSFVNYGTGQARYVQSTYSMTASENNNFLTGGGNMLFLNGTNYPTVEAFSNATGFDLNSVNTNPLFNDTLACTTCNDTLDGGGMATGITLVDINGEVRSVSTPDIGAIEYIAAGSFDLGDDTTYCANEFLLEAGPAQSVTWNIDGTPSSNPTFMLQAGGNQPQTFNVSVNIVTNGCGPASDNLAITLVPGASLDSNVHICADDMTTLNPGGGGSATYAWNDGSVGATLDVAAPGTYTVTKMEDGCSSDATTVVTQSDAVDILDIEPCADDVPVSIDGTVQDGISYAWSGGDNPTSATNTFNQSDIYSVTATDVFGCISVDTFSITVLDQPVAAITYAGGGGTGFFFNSTSSQFTSTGTTYNWTFDNGNTSTDPNPFYTFPWNGNSTTYTVSLEIDNGCGTDLTQIDVIVDPLGIPANSNVSDLKLFPNPANTVLNISSEKAWSEMQVEIMDVTGRTLTSQSFNAGQQLLSIDVSDLSAGNYIVSVDTDGSVSTFNVIIK